MYLYILQYTLNILHTDIHCRLVILLVRIFIIGIFLAQSFSMKKKLFSPVNIKIFDLFNQTSVT